MFFNSIRWRLQLWHGLLLIFVLTGFGLTAYHFERGNRLRRVDQELQHRLSVLMGAMRRGSDIPGRVPVPRERLRAPERLPGEEPPPRAMERSFPDEPLRRPGPGLPSEPLFPQPFFPQPPRELRLTAQETMLFESALRPFYYAVWLRNGNVLERSDGAGEVPRPSRRTELNPFRMRGTYRELVHFNPPGECILVGVDIAADLAEIRQLAWLLLGAGGSVLLLGLAGGWWLASRAMRPIQDISATATKISTGDLSQRIPAGDTENELGQLAEVLNSTFARLDAAFQQQARFTSDAAHELRTPVSVMLTQTQSTLARERSGAEYRESLEACQRAAQRMRRLIESLLDLARLDAGQETMQRERVDLSRVAADCLALVRPLAAERRVTLHSELQPAECIGDSERLAQLMTNLLTNAIHYNREGGEVRVFVQAQNGAIRLEVSDTGSGIAADELPHIFERFWRADKSRTRAEGRAGLGLAIAKSIVEVHGGSLGAESEPGRGSTFTVRLPAAP
jgi:two-component system, OmpR family, sensor kinase